MRHIIDATGEEWLRQFEMIRDEFLAKFRATAERFRVKAFHLCDQDGEPEDRVWNSLTPAGLIVGGAIEQAEDYIAYAIDDGFAAAYAVTSPPSPDPPEIWVTRWEDPQTDPKWPESIPLQFVERHDGVFRVEHTDPSNGGA